MLPLHKKEFAALGSKGSDCIQDSHATVPQTVAIHMRLNTIRRPIKLFSLIYTASDSV
jgi:hypothetical protein